MEDYELAEQFEDMWPKYPKNMPLFNKKASCVVMFLKAENLRVYIELSVGPRGGLTERVYVVDPAQRIVADRLLVRSTTGTFDKGAIVSLPPLRQRIAKVPAKERKATALQICFDALWDLAGNHAVTPLQPSTLRLIESDGHSLYALQGGLPSHGRNGGGR